MLQSRSLKQFWSLIVCMKTFFPFLENLFVFSFLNFTRNMLAWVCFHPLDTQRTLLIWNYLSSSSGKFSCTVSLMISSCLFSFCSLCGTPIIHILDLLNWVLIFFFIFHLFRSPHPTFWEFFLWSSNISSMLKKFFCFCIFNLQEFYFLLSELFLL